MYYHLKIIFRNLQRQGLYSRINIAGLSVSLATVILITLWVNDELSFDKFHKHGKDIYLTLSSFYSGVYWTASAPPLATAGIAEIPEVENACRVYDDSDVKYLKFNDNTLTDIRGSLVDLSFFSMFDIKVKQGNVSALFTDDYSVILSESASTALFGKDDPMDKTIVDNAGRRFTVTGIIADLPQNSSIRCNVIFPFSLYEATKIGLEYFYPLVVNGGVILFDEYGIRPWEGESAAVDEFFKGKDVILKRFDWAPTPGGFFIKNE